MVVGRMMPLYPPTRSLLVMTLTVMGKLGYTISRVMTDRTEILIADRNNHENRTDPRSAHVTALHAHEPSRTQDDSANSHDIDEWTGPQACCLSS